MRKITKEFKTPQSFMDYFEQLYILLIPIFLFGIGIAEYTRHQEIDGDIFLVASIIIYFFSAIHRQTTILPKLHVMHFEDKQTQRFIERDAILYMMRMNKEKSVDQLIMEISRGHHREPGDLENDR